MFGVYILLITWMIFMDRKKVNQYFSAFIEERFIGQIEKSIRVTIVANITYYLLFTLIFVQLYRFQKSGTLTNYYFISLSIFTTLVLWDLVKKIGQFITGWIFGVELLVQHYEFYNLLNRLVISISILPIILLVHYQPFLNHPVSLYFLLSLSILPSILKIKRISKLSFNQFSIPIYHNILYICTLEILPLIVVWKTLIGKI